MWCIGTLAALCVYDVVGLGAALSSLSLRRSVSVFFLCLFFSHM